ncbi:hypothetical protein KM043_007871 [Ampulex compressa]|nr:hypothetical protein KM043_007871 [Ampulex compressa]
MVFIHGESFEWNSGNPYDGTILAAYGNIVFVTINFRLGILGRRKCRQHSAAGARPVSGAAGEPKAEEKKEKEPLARARGGGGGRGRLVTPVALWVSLVSPREAQRITFPKPLSWSAKGMARVRGRRRPGKIWPSALAKARKGEAIALHRESALHLGFLRPGIRDDTASNFGLLDQIAALLWLRENIAYFGGDPSSITLLGHDTGAIFANLLLISPVANRKGLFNRAVLMSGSALSADAIGKAPLQITKQVAHALNCPTTTDSDLALCLRSQEVDTLLKVRIHKPKYVPAYAPLIDNAVIPDKPLSLMENAQLLGRFDLMYGVTESEKFYVLPPVALLHGVIDNQRDEILRDHAKATHELEPELVLSKILEHYGEFWSGYTDEYTTKNRDMVLDALSDGGTVAPLIMTANLHSRANPKSYMYVFTHPKVMQDYSGQQRQRTVHGEELPYVLGEPLDRNKYDLRRRYTDEETLFSEAMMNWWSSFAYIGNPNVAKRYPYLTGGFKEWRQYEIDWPEYSPQNQTYLNLTIPPAPGSGYRSPEMQFWNEDLPNMLKYPNKDIPLSSKPKGPRPQILDIADGVGRYANASSNKDYEIYGARYTTRGPSSVTDTSVDQDAFPIFVTTSRIDEENTTSEPIALRSSSVITMVIGFGVVFLLINFTAFLYMYRKRSQVKTKEKPLKRRTSQREDPSKRPKMDKHENHYGELGYKSDSKPDLNDVIKNDKAYDNNSNFGRRSKLSRQNSGSTIDTHIKVREWIQQEIVHRCSPRFLRKTRETLQKEHQEKLTKQEEEERRLMEEQMLKEKLNEPIYDESPALVVRPGKKSKLPKVSVAVDATPATRTESILNQVPIELSRTTESTSEAFDHGLDFQIPDPSQFQMSPQVVVIEHHHSKSDPLPMESVLKSVRPNFSTPRIYESDSGSASSLYAKINPKLKCRMPRSGLRTNQEGASEEYKCREDRATGMEDIYAKSGPKLTTFGVPAGDVNVTCREPTVERECISPEEALRTIKRRNYPKVLPDIEKRRSLPAPSSLFVPKQHAGSLKDYKNGLHGGFSGSQPPLPPPRVFGTSKSLDFAEESEGQHDAGPITTNLYVGPLLKKHDCSPRNKSDPSIIDSFETNGVQRVQTGGSVDSIYTNPLCPVHGVSLNSQSVDEDIGSPSALLETGIGNPNWYKPAASRNEVTITTSTSEPRIMIKPREPELQAVSNSNWDSKQLGVEPRIVIRPREPELQIGAGSIFNRRGANGEPRIVITPREPEATLGSSWNPRGADLESRAMLKLKESESRLNEYPTWQTQDSNSDPNLPQTRDLESPLNRDLKEPNTDPRHQIKPKEPDHQAGVNWDSKCPSAEPRIVITPRVGNLLGQASQNLGQTVLNLTAACSEESIDPNLEGHSTKCHILDNSTVSSRERLEIESSPDSKQQTERREPRIIIAPKCGSSNLKQPKIIIKPTTSLQRGRDQRNIPKVSAIPSPEGHQACQALDRDQARVGGEKPALREKPKVTRIPSFSRRKEEAGIEKSHVEKTEVVQRVEAATCKVPAVSTTPDGRSSIPTLQKKESEKSSSTDSSSASNGNSSGSNTGTVKRKPAYKK